MIKYQIVGIKAEELLPKIEEAIASYRWRERGDYTIWPGPNSNTFVANILRQVPNLSASAPSPAIGRDFPTDGRWIRGHKNGALFATLGGYLGVMVGGGNGVEINLLGLVAGINTNARQVLIPAFGAFNFS